MTLLSILLIIYIAISLGLLLYTKSDSKSNLQQIQALFVLCGSNRSITKRRINHAKNLVRSSGATCEILVTGYSHFGLMKLLEDLSNKCLLYPASKNTSEDAMFCRKHILERGYNKIGIVTSHAHQLRALNTFKSRIPSVDIYCFPTSDIFSYYSPFLPTGWYAGVINFYKDKKYNRTKS
jgi:uncharacterized SAM-binding protein YcdF (DUF218 family)